MLYPTHRRYGILFGLLMFPIGVALGLIPIITASMRTSDIAMVVICSYMGMRGALFGAEFPDIDSPNSIPAQKHPFIKKIFQFFNVKHRGKFSHDLFSQTVFFGGIFFLLSIGSERWLNNLVHGSQFVLSLTVLGTLCFVWFISLDLVDLLQWGANLCKNQRWWAILNKNRLKIGGVAFVVLTLLLMFNGVINIFEVVSFNVSLSSALSSAMILVASFKVYVLFALAGSYSHLIADMTTKAGISIFFIPIAPAKAALKLKKIPLIGRLLVPTDFKTGSKWEDFVRSIITVLCIPAFMIAFYSLHGWDMNQIMSALSMGMGR